MIPRLAPFGFRAASSLLLLTASALAGKTFTFPQTSRPFKPPSTLQGFTIQNGTLCCFPYEGGGIEVSNSSPTILSNNIPNNVGAGNGGGINISSGSPVVKGKHDYRQQRFIFWRD